MFNALVPLVPFANHLCFDHITPLTNRVTSQLPPHVPFSPVTGQHPLPHASHIVMRHRAELIHSVWQCLGGLTSYFQNTYPIIDGTNTAYMNPM